MTSVTHSPFMDSPLNLESACAWPLHAGAASLLWESVAASVEKWQLETDLIPAQVTVVLPFAQLLSPLRQAWCARQQGGFLPRFETTQTWSARLGGLHQPGAGPAGDAVLNHLQARAWLQQLSLGQARALADALVEPLVAIAHDLMQAAGALPPSKRAAYWAQATHMAAQAQPGVAGVEAALAPLAVAWAAATEGWSSDILFETADKAHAQTAQGLVVIQAGGADALSEHLYACWPKAQRLWLNLDAFAVQNTGKDAGEGIHKDKAVSQEGDPLQAIAREHPPQWQVATGAEDEAEQAAAQVISLLNGGAAPVALCTQDRLIARRVWALLKRQNIALADETGWTLSTTRCAALVMGLVRSAMWDATPDALLDAFKSLPEGSSFTQGLNELEAMLRKMSASNWPVEPPPYWPQSAQRMLRRINEVVGLLRGSGRRSLWAHLHVLTQVLKTTQAWLALQSDDAGREVLRGLHFSELYTEQTQTFASTETDDELEAMLPPGSTFAQQAQATLMSYADFAHWVSHALETVTFIPPAPPQPLVVLTPLARVMLRPFAAVVIPGCDDSRLTAPPSLPGFWRESDRIALGLMNRKRWWQRLQAQWVQALRLPQVTLIWRNAEGSQPLGPASLVQSVIAPGTTGQAHEAGSALDKRVLKILTPQPTPVPAPRPARRLPMVSSLSASGYKTLRDCPYQFYALYWLKLREHEELDTELDQRDYGNWLHAVLRQFHATRAQHPVLPTPESDAHLLDACAKEQAQSFDPASLIPWQARWPAVKEAYLYWLREHEHKGGQFVRAEFDMRYALTPDITLQGRIDRMDQLGSAPVLIDYKTERLKATKSRVLDAYEDVQLPFYALLVQGQLVQKGEITQHIDHAQQAQAFYLSLDDNEEVSTAVGHTDLDDAKAALRQGMIEDMQRLEEGFPAYPIGQAKACTYCSAIGLCRKAYWSTDEVIPEGAEGAGADSAGDAS